MIECPSCLKISSYKKHCEHCGAVLIETPEDKFYKAAEALEKLLKTELATRKKNRRRGYLLAAAWLVLVLSLAAFIAVAMYRKKYM